MSWPLQATEYALPQPPLQLGVAENPSSSPWDEAQVWSTFWGQLLLFLVKGARRASHGRSTPPPSPNVNGVCRAAATILWASREWCAEDGAEQREALRVWRHCRTTEWRPTLSTPTDFLLGEKKKSLGKPPKRIFCYSQLKAFLSETQNWWKPPGYNNNSYTYWALLYAKHCLKSHDPVRWYTVILSIL